MVAEQRVNSYTVSTLKDFEMGVVKNDGIRRPVEYMIGESRSDRLEKRVGALPDDIRAITQKSELDEDDCRRINAFLRQAGIFCDVTFRTSRPGADVYAQLRGELTESPIGKSDVVKKQFPSGLYWVWAVRNGVRTERHLEDILASAQEVYIPEE
jgi:hypothetical protein